MSRINASCERLDLLVSTQAKQQLERLAFCFGLTQRTMLERTWLASSAPRSMRCRQTHRATTTSDRSRYSRNERCCQAPHHLGCRAPQPRAQVSLERPSREG